MNWEGIGDLAWERIALNPIFLFLTAWFASGVLLGRVPERYRLLTLGVLGVMLQGILRGAALPAFELVNLFVYGYACVVRRRGKRVSADRTVVPSAKAISARRRWLLCCAGMFGLIGIAFVGRELHWEQSSSLVTAQGQWVLIALDFWQLVRLVTFLHEYGSGVEELPGLRLYLLWANLPPIGVVIRLSELAPQIAKMTKPTFWAEVFEGKQLRLLTVGAVKWGAAYGLLLITEASFFPEHPWAYKVAAVFLFGPWSFVLAAAGLNDVQRFIGRAWNLNVPMAWDAPLLRTNLSRFWATWNITLTAVYRDYLFFNRWGLARPNLYLNTIIVFIVMGLFHALNWYWFLFGVYHALGFCVYLGYQQIKRAYSIGPSASSRATQFACWLLTYVFVCLGWLIPSKIVVYLGLS